MPRVPKKIHEMDPIKNRGDSCIIFDGSKIRKKKEKYHVNYPHSSNIYLRRFLNSER
jgi:hypothetical protein